MSIGEVLDKKNEEEGIKRGGRKEGWKKNVQQS